MAGCVSFGTTAANLCIDMDTHDERAKVAVAGVRLGSTLAV